jgi:hypothetical protein
MLYTDHESANVKQKLTKDNFIRGNVGIGPNSSRLPDEYMSKVCFSFICLCFCFLFFVFCVLFFVFCFLFFVFVFGSFVFVGKFFIDIKFFFLTDF